MLIVINRKRSGLFLSQRCYSYIARFDILENYKSYSFDNIDRRAPELVVSLLLFGELGCSLEGYSELELHYTDSFNPKVVCGDTGGEKLVCPYTGQDIEAQRIHVATLSKRKIKKIKAMHRISYANLRGLYTQENEIKKSLGI